jgi:hypothetical protein
MAGFLDSDGSIYAYKRTDGKRPYYRVFVTVTNSNHDICDWFMARTCMGNVYKSSYGENEKHSQVWRWIVQKGDDSVRLLRMLLPELRVKRNRAEIAINLLELRDCRPSLEVEAKKEYLFTQLKQLSKRGPR